MDKYLRGAIEGLLRESMRCSADHHGFIQGMPMICIADLMLQYDKYCKKHGKVPVRYREHS